MGDKDIVIKRKEDSTMLLCNKCCAVIVIKASLAKCKCIKPSDAWGIYDIVDNKIIYQGYDTIKVH